MTNDWKVGSRLRSALLLAALGAVVLSSCASTGQDPAESAASSPAVSSPVASSPTSPAATLPQPEVIDTITTGLAAPWSVAFLPDGSALVSERDTAEVIHLTGTDDGTWSAQPVGEIAGVDPNGEGGLLGLAVLPTALGSTPSPAVDIVAYWSTGEDNRVGVMSWDGSVLGPPRPILTGIPHAGFHNGGRLLAAPDGTLFIATGDAGEPELAQDPDSLAGKVLRINADGSVPQDNPTPGSPVYSSGHRNIQGLAFDDQGRLWASEFGSSDVDELNLIEPDGNYGWPIHEGAAGDPRFIDPAAQWSPTSVASPSGLAIAGGSAWIAGLRGQTLWQVPITAGVAGQPVARFEESYGRLRDVVVAPDGTLWLVTNNTDGRGEPRDGDDRILRVRI